MLAEYEKRVCKHFLRETMQIILAKYLMVPSHASSYSLYWWKKQPVVALKHLKKIKHTILFQQQEAYKINKSS
jgi:hypothetical protein